MIYIRELEEPCVDLSYPKPNSDLRHRLQETPRSRMLGGQVGY